MDTMSMSDGGTMSLAWMPMCGQSWGNAVASFLLMWTIMMAAMMLPSWVPLMWRYRHSGPLPVALVLGGYLFVWTLLGAAIYPLGTVVMAVTMRYATLERALPFAAGLIVLTAGTLQFTRWKAHQLACCRRRDPVASGYCGRAVAADPATALRHGLSLGVHCCQCCAGLTAVLLVSGLMDVPAMIAVTAGITLERLAPGGERIARAIGVIVTGAGLFLIVRAAAGLS